MLAAGRRSRAIFALLVAVAALVVSDTASAGPRDLEIDRGVVQSVSAAQIVLRELDGSTVALAVDGSTRVLLNGAAAQLTDILPGFVAAVAHNGSRPARLIRAFGRVATVVDRGTIASVSPGQFVLRRGDGSLLTIRVTAATRIRLNGLPAKLRAIRPGRFARVVHAPNGTAQLVQLFGRPAA